MKHFWTVKQRSIVKRIRRRYRQNGQIRWRRALQDHPEWIAMLPKHLPLPRLAKQLCILGQKRTGEEMAIRALETRLWNLRHRRAYLSQLMVSPKTHKQLRRFKETFGYSYRTVVERSVNQFYIRTFGKHKSMKGDHI